MWLFLRKEFFLKLDLDYLDEDDDDDNDVAVIDRRSFAFDTKQLRQTRFLYARNTRISLELFGRLIAHSSKI